MVKKYTVTDAEIRNYIAPELSGKIVGKRDDIVPLQTVEEIEALHKQAYQEGKQQGYDAGFQQGHDKGYAEMQEKAEEFQEKSRQLESILHFLEQPLKEMSQDVEHQLAELSVMLAKQLLKIESRTDPQHIFKLVEESLEYLPLKSRNVSVHLNQEDIALLNQAELDIENQSWTIVADNSVTAGGCKIESDASHIDSTVETRIEQLVEQMQLHQADEDDAAE